MNKLTQYYYLRCLGRKTVFNKVAFANLGLALKRKARLETQGLKVMVYRTDTYGNAKRIA